MTRRELTTSNCVMPDIKTSRTHADASNIVTVFSYKLTTDQNYLNLLTI